MKITPRTKKIREQILRDVIHHPNDIANHIAEIFGISRQAVNKHLQALVADKWLDTSGSTRSKICPSGRNGKRYENKKPTLMWAFVL